MLRFVFTMILWFLIQFGAYSQGVPNCRDINASVDEFGMIRITPMDLITNISGDIDTVTVTISNDLNEILYGPVTLAITDPIVAGACHYVGKTLKINVRNNLGACWSTLSVKKIYGPVILGRTFDAYCFDSLVHKPDLPPVTIDACGGQTKPRYVTDWLIPFVCMPGIQDTVKVILREWEAIGKDGIRGVGYDTIVVFYLPQITAQNIYCVDKDTVYCNDLNSFIGPVISIPGTPLNPAMCIDLPLIHVEDVNKDGILEFSSYGLDKICDFSTHIDYELFEIDCSKQYKITIDIKQSCYAAPQTTCIVPFPAGTPPNIAQNLAPGYWRCEFWLVDLDTLPPDLHCKYPILFSGVFDEDNWIEILEGDGYVDTLWSPYKISLVGNDNGSSGSTNYCIQAKKDTVLAFAWELRSQNSDAMYDPFGYLLNGEFYLLTKGIPGASSGPVYQNGYKIIELRSGDQFCFSQQSTDGIDGPGITAVKQLPVVTTSDHDCVAHSYIPPVTVEDDWSGVKYVKARIPEIGTYLMTYNAANDCYESHQRAPLPHRAEPYMIIYEAQDSCHNTVVDTCYILVKDRVKPTAVVDKGLTVSLSEKKIWVDAEEFDEGSFDNCKVNLLLVRRADWFESCVDLCDSLDTICVNSHGDTLWLPHLETDKHINPVEAHYAQNLQWWKEDGGPCSNIIYNSWIYDLIRRGTYNCKDHPYEYHLEHVDALIQECLPSVMNQFLPVALHPDPYREGEEVLEQEDFRVDNRLLQTYSQIGGGWSDAVPFDCTDACGSVTVEILVMDFWCNWSKAWTKVWVEDKVPMQVVKDVEDLEITCKIYKTARYDLEGYNQPLSIESIIDLAKEKDEIAIGALDEIFGGYTKVWRGPYGNYLDENGSEVDQQIPFVDSACYCEIDEIVQKRYYDEHLGHYWKSDTIWDCGYETVRDTFNVGLVVANCNNYLGCDQEIWCEIDHCGEGYIYRKFKVWQGCPASYYTDENVPESLKKAHLPDTVTRIQRIRVYNECRLDKHQFDVPPDVELISCGIEYEEDGSGKVGGDLHPDHLGWMRYQFDDDCRLIGIDYEDKVFKIVGGEAACYKILRTWYYTDWCAGQPTDKYWYHRHDLAFDSCVQHIFLIDTIAPVCEIEGPVTDGETIAVGDCYYDFEATVNMQDSCGIIAYTWSIFEISELKKSLVDSYTSQPMSSAQTSFTVNSADLGAGSYELKVVITDDCGNDGECYYFFDVQAIKKPTAICFTSLTARLNAMDLDQDGDIDTAMVTIWANEYDRSSREACEDSELEFRLELLDGVGDDSWQDDADSLQLGCEHIGTQLLRMWVISWPSGTSDYCDIVGVIMSNTGCVQMPIDSTVASITQSVINQQNTTTQTKKSEFQNGSKEINIPLKLASSQSKEVNDIDLNQNFPNPFSFETTISFILPRAMHANITIFNINGQMIKVISGEFLKGENQLVITNDLFADGGVYYYQLNTASFHSTRRMVYIK
ncbi:MAG: T9SS type A sorting domain-containing protein [Saprospiraceae bacterium]|nr:T9SS type A sorting domain-containing protein [Saprospiraceae bacterium]